MQVFQTFAEFPTKLTKEFVTIGNFDGIHLGHQSVIRTVVQEAAKNQCATALITFENHPLEVLNPGREIFRICTPLHKERLISALGIDTLFNITFTQEFSKQDPETFLRSLTKEIGLVKLILGYDAKIGKEREGDKDRVEKLSKEIGFEVEYLPPFLFEDKPVSSSAIRHSIQKGEFPRAKELLGRPYSILSLVSKGSQKGTEFGIRTANLEVSGLALPPFGVYLVSVKSSNKTYWGIANLGVAPTVRQEGNPLLEVHIFDFERDIYGAEIEVIFLDYLRPEIKFDSVDLMLEQIRRDIFQAKERIANIRNSV